MINWAMAPLSHLWRAGAAALLFAICVAGCTSDQDPGRTPIGSVVTGKTDPNAYLDQVQQANQDRQAGGQTVSPVGPGSNHY